MNCSTKIFDEYCDGSLDSYLEQISTSANMNLNIDTKYVINSINITQEYPFDVEVRLNITYNISDKGDPTFASWDKNEMIAQTVSIINLKDPLVGVNTNGTFERKIVRTNICSANDTCWDINKMTQFYSLKEYRHYVNSSSYLQRFWNDSSQSACCGLETLLDKSVISFSKMASYTDHTYWNASFDCSNPDSIKVLEINATAYGFKLDEATAARYYVTESGVVVCPS